MILKMSQQQAVLIVLNYRVAAAEMVSLTDLSWFEKIGVAIAVRLSSGNACSRDVGCYWQRV